jgi:phosphoglycolate phosphatase
LNKIDTVLFDMDGTILDTLGDTSAAAQEVCRHLGLPVVSREYVKKNMGHGIGRLVEALLPQGTDAAAIPEAIAVYKEYYSQHYLDTSSPYPGVIRLLEQLDSKGLKMAVISNKAEEFTKAINNKLFGKYIKVAVGEIPGMKLKPNPEPVRKGLFLLGSDADSAVYVGDTEVDRETADNSGLRFIACAWGMRGKAKLMHEGVPEQLIADTPADVWRIYTSVK